MSGQTLGRNGRKFTAEQRADYKRRRAARTVDRDRALADLGLTPEGPELIRLNGVRPSWTAN
jgi:hypothetical protein